MGVEKDFFRNISDSLTAKPARFLADKGIPADVVTTAGLVAGVGGIILSFRNHQIAERYGVSSGLVKNIGVALFGLSLYLDILDGKVAREQSGTKYGAVFDNGVDGAVETFIAVQGATCAPGPDVSVWERFMINVRRPSTVRAAGEAYGLKISEIDPGSRLARVPGEVLLLALENYRPQIATLVTTQAAISTAYRFLRILSSGNLSAATEAGLSLVLQEGLFEATRNGNRRNFGANMLSQCIPVGFSTIEKIRKVLSA